MELQVGDIILYKGNGFLSKAVKFFTKSEYSHVSMVISDTHLIEANWYKKSNIIEFKYDETEMEIYRVKDLTIEQQIVILQRVYKYIDKYYDYAQIIGHLIESFGLSISHHLNSDKKLICSELIDRAYADINIDLVESRKTGDVTPNDIAKSELLNRIY